MLLFVTIGRKAGESKPVKLETSRTVILPPKPSVLRYIQYLYLWSSPSLSLTIIFLSDTGKAEPGTETSALALQSSYQQPPAYQEATYDETEMTPVLNNEASIEQQTSVTVVAVANEIIPKPKIDTANDAKRHKDVDESDAIAANNGDADGSNETGSQSPNIVSISMMESGPNSVYLALNTASPCTRSQYTEDDEDEEEEDDNLSLTSRGTPCSQCLRDEEEATLQAADDCKSRIVVGGSKFYNGDRSHTDVDAEQQTSDDSCSVESGSLCCNSSCCEEHRPVGLTRRSGGGKRISLTEEAVTKLGHRSQSSGDAAAGMTTAANGSEGSLRQLVTFVTPGLETVPLEMCQDIPDVMI